MQNLCVKFTDDMELLAEEEMILMDILLELDDSCEQDGLKMNENKTKTVAISKIKKINVRIRIEAVERVNCFKYLGCDDGKVGHIPLLATRQIVCEPLHSEGSLSSCPERNCLFPRRFNFALPMPTKVRLPPNGTQSRWRGECAQKSNLAHRPEIHPSQKSHFLRTVLRSSVLEAISYDLFDSRTRDLNHESRHTSIHQIMKMQRQKCIERFYSEQPKKEHSELPPARIIHNELRDVLIQLLERENLKKCTRRECRRNFLPGLSTLEDLEDIPDRYQKTLMGDIKTLFEVICGNKRKFQ
ncbi:hypothetical protein ANN_12995 [Periplaneta americana]|uniref:Reverse transcriptase domain-containing protein n=1 Tax=Periplaneta americana TaxID=6978 RepID=A0ABQ8TKD2_PERAM|nr:hypothetical protein ANN_12995 [Periplaneta americana]